MRFTASRLWWLARKKQGCPAALSASRGDSNLK
jgi:hypothetical protein